MKPFLGIDLTNDKKNQELNGAEFLVMQPSAAMAQVFEQSSRKATETLQRSRLPLPLRIVQMICGTFAMICIAGLMRALGEVTIFEAYENAPALAWLTGACLLIWGILKIISIAKQKAVLNTEESTHILTSLKKASDAIYAEMAVPTDAKEVDILSFLYKIKKGQIKRCERGMQLYSYFNPVYKVFTDDENLYLADLKEKYAFALSSLVAIHTIKKRIQVGPWNKKESFNKGIYKQYKLTNDNVGGILCRQYHIIEVNHNGIRYGIYIPSYELPIFEELTGLTAESNQ